MNAFRRPLRVKLRDDDVLFFLHIHKTGGLSLISVLEAMYEPEQIFPLHSLPDLAMMNNYPPSKLARYRLVRGHLDFGPYDNSIYRYIAPNPIIITFLRDPVARVISNHGHQVRQGHVRSDLTLEEYVCGTEYRDMVWNYQVRALVGAVRDKETLADEVLLQLAVENLEQVAFFGLTERFAESVHLLAYTFDWPRIKSIPVENAAPRPFNRSRLTPQLLAEIQARTHLDAKLYNYACELFDARYTQMVEELLDEAHALRHIAVLWPGINTDELYARVKQTYQVSALRAWRLNRRVQRVIRWRVIGKDTRREQWLRRFQSAVAKATKTSS